MNVPARVLFRLTPEEHQRLTQLTSELNTGIGGFVNKFIDSSNLNSHVYSGLSTAKPGGKASVVCTQLISTDNKEIFNSVCSNNNIPSTRFISSVLLSLTNSEIKSLMINESKKSDFTELVCNLRQIDFNRISRLCELSGSDLRGVLQQLLKNLSDGEVCAILNNDPSLVARFNEQMFFEKFVTELSPILFQAAHSGACTGIVNLMESIESESD